MSANSIPLDKLNCLQCLQEVVNYLQQGQEISAENIVIALVINDLIDSIEHSVINWRKLSSLYQRAGCLLMQIQSLIPENDEMHEKIQHHVEAFEQSHAAICPHVKEEIRQNIKLSKLGFPQQALKTA